MKALLFFLLFYLLHSLLAANAVKNRVKQRLPRLYPAYRLAYNLLSLSLFGYAMALHLRNDASPLLPGLAPMLILGLILLSLGLIITALAVKGYNLSEFSGLKPESPHPTLGRAGLNRLVRHPIYTGLILAFAGFFLLYPSTERGLLLVLSYLYLFLGIRLEESKLIQTFGAAYLNYRKEVPMLFPGINFFKKTFGRPPA